jgi:hypothetical protein
MASYPASLKWPPVFGSDGDLEVVEDAHDLRQALQYQGLTVTNEVLMTEDGSDIKHRVFEQNDAVLESLLKAAMRDTVERMLPDVEIVHYKFTFNRE